MSGLRLTQLTLQGSSRPLYLHTQDTQDTIHDQQNTDNQRYKTCPDFLHTLRKKSRFITFQSSDQYSTLTTCGRLQCKLSTLTLITLSNFLVLVTWACSQNGNGPAQNQQQTQIKLAIHSSTSKDKQPVWLCYL